MWWRSALVLKCMNILILIDNNVTIISIKFILVIDYYEI